MVAFGCSIWRPLGNSLFTYSLTLLILDVKYKVFIYLTAVYKAVLPRATLFQSPISWRTEKSSFQYRLLSASIFNKVYRFMIFFSFLPTRKYCSISFKKCWNIVVQSFVLKFDVWRYQWLLASGSFPRPVPLTAKSVQVLPRRSTPVPRSQFVFFSTHQSYYNILKGYFYYN